MRLENGREYLYQWDKYQRVILDSKEDNMELHFACPCDGEDTALSVKPYVEDDIIYADIPNILLQRHGCINIYKYIDNGDVGYTYDHFMVGVRRREKPSDYVYEEIEILSYKKLATEQLEQLKKNLSQLSEEIVNLTTSGLTTAQVNALDGMFKKCAFVSNATTEYEAFKNAFGIGENGGEVEPDEPSEPDNPEVTLASISATYTGGNVAVGTAVSSLTGITVKATYSDGSTANVTGYTLSGTIAEGSNTITVSYGGKTTTFTVTGVAESGGDEPLPDGFVNLFTANLRKTTDEDVSAGIGSYTGNFTNTDADIQLTGGVTYYVYSLFTGTTFGLNVFNNNGSGNYTDSGLKPTKTNAWFINDINKETYSVEIDGTSYNLYQMSFTPTEDCSVRLAFNNKCVGNTYPDYNYLFTKEYNPHKDSLS